MDRFVQLPQRSWSVFRIKSDQTPHTCTTRPPGAQINALFALRSTFSELWTVLSKLGQRSLSASRIKRGQTSHTSTTVPLGAQINTLFSLRSTVSELCTVLSKLRQRSLSAPIIKSDHTPHKCTTICPGLKLTLYSLYDRSFPSYGPFCPTTSKVIECTQNQK